MRESFDEYWSGGGIGHGDEDDLTKAGIDRSLRRAEQIKNNHAGMI